MTVTIRPPNKIVLTRELSMKISPSTADVIDNAEANEIILPGQFIEPVDNSGKTQWKLQTGVLQQALPYIADVANYLNKTLGIEAPYAIGDMLDVVVLWPGCSIFTLLKVSEDVANAELMQVEAGNVASAAATTAAANVARLTMLDNPGIVAALQRVRVRWNG